MRGAADAKLRITERYPCKLLEKMKMADRETAKPMFGRVCWRSKKSKVIKELMVFPTVNVH